MTMLDRMRRHKNWLKWSLFLVVVAFIALYFPDFIGARAGSPASLNAEVARVGDERITAGTFRRVGAPVSGRVVHDHHVVRRSGRVRTK